MRDFTDQCIPQDDAAEWARAEECPHLCQGCGRARGYYELERYKDGRWLCEGCMESNDGT